MRQDLHRLIEKLAPLEGLKDLCLTTNGALLADQVDALAKAGLKRVNVSIDTLDADKFKRMTKRGDLDKVLEGIFAAKAAGMAPLKLNAVIERGVNDDDILPLVEFSRANGFAMRFIEYMDVGNSNNWTSQTGGKKTDYRNDPRTLSAAGIGRDQAARRRWTMIHRRRRAISA